MILVKKLRFSNLIENSAGIVTEGKKISFQYAFSTNQNDDSKNKNASKMFKTPSYYDSQKDQEYMKEKGLYQHLTNYNFEQHKEYTKALNELIQNKQEIEENERAMSDMDKLPRRRRRIYDKPKYDWDITNYNCWRIYENILLKSHDNALPVVCKIQAPPVLVKRVFGDGLKASRNSKATLEYDFEDGNLDLFLLYDYKATTEFWGANSADYDYENQDNIPPRKRKQRWPSVEEFWKGEEPVEFRVNCTPYADFRKFKKWFLTQLETKKDKESYDEYIFKKYGPLETYDNFKKTYSMELEPAVFKYDLTYFMDEAEKKKTPVKLAKLQAAKHPGNEFKLKSGRFIEE